MHIHFHCVKIMLHNRTKESESGMGTEELYIFCLASVAGNIELVVVSVGQLHTVWETQSR